MLEPGKVYEYSLDLWHTGIAIPAKHRLRVEVSSASFPLYDGRHSRSLPAVGQPTDRYIYDPGDPTPDPRVDHNDIGEDQ